MARRQYVDSAAEALSMGFLKLDCGLLNSSVWFEGDQTRLTWLTLLLMADPTGLVEATAPGIAARANLPVEAVRKALEIFMKPDPDSKSAAFEGRRIERVDGGFLVLNYIAYRNKDHTAAARMKRYRERIRQSEVTVTRNVTAASSLEVLKKEKLKGRRAEIAELADEIATKLKFTGGVRKAALEDLVRADPEGIAGVRKALVRAVRYYETAKAEKWRSFIIARRFSKFLDFYGDVFSSDDSLAAYLERIRASNAREERKLKQEDSLHVGAHRSEPGPERDPLEDFLEKFPEELSELRPDFERFRETRKGAAEIEEKLLELFKDNEELAQKEAFFAKNLAKVLRTPETLRRYRVNYIHGKFYVPELEETE